MNSGRANKAALRLIVCSFALMAGLFVSAWVGYHLGAFILAYPLAWVGLWLLFALVVLFMSRDPDPIEPSDDRAIVSPAHGKVDAIEEAMESSFMKGACKRISIRVSLFDVQVQNAPVAGTIACLEHQRPVEQGAAGNEYLFVGFDVVGRSNARIAVRVVGGAWGKRILPWIQSNDVVPRSVRIAMTRPASRVELHLPLTVKLRVNPGDEVVGGQSVIAQFE